MKIITQNGVLARVDELEFNGCVIYGHSVYPKAKVELGRYEDLKRTIEVWSEIACLAHNEKEASYVMPKK